MDVVKGDLRINSTEIDWPTTCHVGFGGISEMSATFEDIAPLV
jgi:hypothetical protein